MLLIFFLNQALRYFVEITNFAFGFCIVSWKEENMSLLMWNSNLQRITFAIINVLQMFIYGFTQYFFGDVIIFLLMLLFLKLGVEN